MVMKVKNMTLGDKNIDYMLDGFAKILAKFHIPFDRKKVEEKILKEVEKQKKKKLNK